MQMLRLNLKLMQLYGIDKPWTIFINIHKTN